MMRLAAICMSVGALLFAAGAAEAIPTVEHTPVKFHACRQSDLIGSTWRMMDLQEDPPLREASWYRGIPYHYLTFYTENRYVYVAADHELTTPDIVRKAMQWPGMGPHTLYYTLDDQGELDLYFDKKVRYRFRCVYVDATEKPDVAAYHKGDLVLTGYTKNSRSHLYKLYRFWFKDKE